MRMTVDEFASITDDAFSFLISEFGYSAKPPARGGRFGTGLVREFVKGDLRIVFIFGNADSNRLCSIAFEDGSINARVQHHHMQRTLSVLLMDRLPDYRQKTREDLTHENAFADIILEYARLLKDYGADAVRGDFSAFPTLVYLLVYVPDRKEPGIARPIAILSSPEVAEKAMTNRHGQMRGHEELEGYEVWSMDTDPLWLMRPEAVGLRRT